MGSASWRSAVPMQLATKASVVVSFEFGAGDSEAGLNPVEYGAEESEGLEWDINVKADGEQVPAHANFFSMRPDLACLGCTEPYGGDLRIAQDYTVSPAVNKDYSLCCNYNTYSKINYRNRATWGAKHCPST